MHSWSAFDCESALHSVFLFKLYIPVESNIVFHTQTHTQQEKTICSICFNSFSFFFTRLSRSLTMIQFNMIVLHISSFILVYFLFIYSLIFICNYPSYTLSRSNSFGPKLLMADSFHIVCDILSSHFIVPTTAISAECERPRVGAMISISWFYNGFCSSLYCCLATITAPLFIILDSSAYMHL